MKLGQTGKLHTDLPWIASHGLKSTADGLAAKSISDMMEQTGPNDPDAVGAYTNQPPAPANPADGNPPQSYGKGQSDD